MPCKSAHRAVPLPLLSAVALALSTSAAWAVDAAPPRTAPQPRTELKVIPLDGGIGRVAPPQPGSVSTAAREGFSGRAAAGPQPLPLPASAIAQPRSETRPSTRPVSSQHAAPIRPDGARGFVDLLPPPPNPDSPESDQESRWYELPPAPGS
ncbi:MAG: hypothetical protein KF774_03630 [Planctomyces sp.]|nr:hypothetical protein [Planctomyces sp.]